MGVSGVAPSAGAYPRVERPDIEAVQPLFERSIFRATIVAHSSPTGNGGSQDTI